MKHLEISALIQKAYWNQISSYKIRNTITVEFAKQYSQQLNWKLISQNETVDWSIEFLQYFQNNLIVSKFTKEVFFEFHQRGFLMEFLQLYSNSINWNTVSKILTDSSQLAECKDKINWKIISKNRMIDWDYKDLKTYSKEIDWKEFCLHCNERTFKESSNYSIDLFFQDFEEFICWLSISFNTSINLSLEQIKTLRHKLHWRALVKNTSISWTPNALIIFENELKEFYKEHWFKQRSHIWKTLVMYSELSLFNETKPLHNRSELKKISDKLMKML